MVKTGLIVLAAGRGSRLEGIAAPFYKPLLVVNGQALLVSALTTKEFTNSVVVLSPSNAAVAIPLVTDAVDRPVNFVVQPTPTGPGDALLLGLQMLTGLGCDKFVAVMGDNTSSREALDSVLGFVHGRQECVVHTQTLPRHEVHRFTWTHDNEWHEKDCVVPPVSEVPCWIGPIGGSIPAVMSALSALEPTGDERLISPIFNMLKTTTVESNGTVFDIGTPDMTKTMT